jgi:chemotaxis protein MotB
LLEDGGLLGTRVARLTGKGDRLLAVPDPLAERNNRLEVIVLRGN